MGKIPAVPKCCHPGSPLLCPHPCWGCLVEKGQNLAAEIRAFERQCADDEHTDIGEALRLLGLSRRLVPTRKSGGR